MQLKHKDFTKRGRRPSILYVIGNLDTGGSETHLTRLLPILRTRSFEPFIYTLTHKGSLAPIIEKSGVEVLEPPLSREMRRLPVFFRRPLLFIVTSLSLWLLLLRRRPDIIHFFLPAGYLIGSLCSLAAGKQLRVMSRRSLNYYQYQHPFLAKLERRIHPRMNAILGNSRAVVSQLAEEGAKPTQLRLIYNGIDVEKYGASVQCKKIRQDLGIADDSLVIVNIANLIPYKGHSDLLAALETVNNFLPNNWVLLCVGHDGGIGAQLRFQAEQMAIGNNVHWLGQRRDIEKLLCVADMGILSSRQEGFSNAVLEGMAAGLPMVVTDVGGNREAVKQGVTGLIIPAADSKALGKAILRLATDPDLRSRLGKAGRARVAERFSMKNCVDKYEQLYAALVGGHPLPILDSDD